MKILLGTNNPNKLQQFRRIFDRLDREFELLSLAEAGIEDEVEEDQDTLLGNARKKARVYGKLSGLPTLADDTGLFVDALGGEPGLHAKRWHQGSELDRCRKLQERLREVPEPERTCRYTGVLAVFFPDRDEFWEYENNTEGVIAAAYRGDQGFGYDPIFRLPDGRHYAELDDAERDQISHRGPGIAELVKYFNK